MNQSTRKKWLLVEIKAIGLDTKLNTERKKNSIKLFRLKKKKDESSFGHAKFEKPTRHPRRATTATPPSKQA